MEIEYSNEVKGLVFAYRFDKYEKALIVEGLKPLIKKKEKQILAVENDPDNEGQVTYQDKIREIRWEIDFIQECIKEFSA